MDSKKIVNQQLTKKIIQYGESSIEVISVIYNGEPYMVANPFAKILEYSNCPNAIAKFVSTKNQIEFQNMGITAKLSSIQPRTKFINMQGIYELTAHSKMPKAKAFWFWIMEELLPQTRDPLFNYHEWCINNQELLNKFKETKLGAVYVATNNTLAADQIYKIGMTRHLKKRLSNLNSGSIHEFFYVFNFKTVHYKKLEKYLHSKFANQNVVRELFVLSNNDLSELLDVCNEFVSNIT